MATAEQMAADPRAFIAGLHFINIPPDCLFCVRFGGETWHQFWPLSRNSLHPVFFALSCHTDELGGNLSDELKAKIRGDQADIPTLTEVLPEDISRLIRSKDFQQEVVPTTTLSLDAPAGTIHRKVCDTVRGSVGLLRGFWSGRYRAGGYVSQAQVRRTVIEMDGVPETSLLRNNVDLAEAHHRDTFVLSLDDSRLEHLPADRILDLLLEGFLNNPPGGVSRLMTIRNLIVSPLGLRTSPLGCPVSSLLSDDRSNLFAGQYPVIDQRIEPDGSRAEVVLGAKDKHLVFRSCVGVEQAGRRIEITLGTCVTCKNAFGHLYMWAISLVHRKYISPTMLRRAADYLVARTRPES